MPLLPCPAPDCHAGQVPTCTTSRRHDHPGGHGCHVEDQPCPRCDGDEAVEVEHGAAGELNGRPAYACVGCARWVPVGEWGIHEGHDDVEGDVREAA